MAPETFPVDAPLVKPGLPLEWFELEELNGHCGQRGDIIRVPQDYDLDTAIFQAQFGDDIVIDHTYTSSSIAARYLPEKTFDATTPRMPPHQKRQLTQSRGLTSAR